MSCRRALTELEIELLEVAEVGLEHMENKLTCWLESACMLDENFNPIRETLEPDQVSGADCLEAQIARARNVIAMARA